MGNYLYNDVELPVLPEWDKTVYPYALIHYGFSSNKYTLWVLDGQCNFHLNILGYDGIYVNNSKKGTYELTDNEWIWCGTNEGIVAVVAIQNEGTVGEIVWSNYDIQNSTDGSVYLAASTPVPVTTAAPLDPTALLMGWMVGKRVAGLRKTQTDVPVVPDEPSGEPVAYLYNGVRLPDINEVWTDKETYPYALICDLSALGTGMTYVLYLSQTPMEWDEDQAMHKVTGALAYSYADGVWSFVGEVPEGYLDPSSMPYLWASHDILNSDGTTYLSASDPIPVYE